MHEEDDGEAGDAMIWDPISGQWYYPTPHGNQHIHGTGHQLPIKQCRGGRSTIVAHRMPREAISAV